jgi:hypothetical protein
LRNKSYCILNKQYAKEDYFDKIQKMAMSGTYSQNTFSKYIYGERNETAYGDNIFNAQNMVF